jgi:hypothetical protein
VLGPPVPVLYVILYTVEYINISIPGDRTTYGASELLRSTVLLTTYYGASEYRYATSSCQQQDLNVDTQVILVRLRSNTVLVRNTMG